jgi:hypothetical protein
MARSTATGPKARNDAYTGLLAISFLALVGATVLMAMDADKLGKPPEKLKIDVPGVTSGKAGEGLKRPDAGKIDAAEAPKDPMPIPMPMPKMPDPGMGKAEPNQLPSLATATDVGTVLPAKAEEPVEGPPLPVKPFVPPM